MMNFREMLNLMEAAEPAWITRIFGLEQGQRETVDINGVELSVAALGIILSDDENPLGIRDLEVPRDQRGMGKSTAILKDLVQAADTYGRPLELAAYPYDDKTVNGRAAPETVQKLVDFYKRFGFEPMKANYSLSSPVGMVYRPK